MAAPKFWHSASHKKEELFYTFFCAIIGFTLVFWPLLNSVFCLGFLFYWIFFVDKKEPLFLKKYWVLLFCLLFLVAAAGLFYSANTRTAFLKLQHKSAFILFPIVLGVTSVPLKAVFKRTFITFTGAVLLGCLFCFFSGVYQFFKTGSKEGLYGYNLVEPLKDMTPFIMGMCCLLGLLYLCDFIFKLVRIEKQNSWQLYITITGAFFLFSFLILLGNRNILLTSCFVLFYYIYRLAKRFWLRLIIAGSVLLTLSVAIYINPFLNQQWTEVINFSENNEIPLDQDSSLGKSWGGWQLRKAIWQCSWDIVKEYPVFGVGTGDSQDSLQVAYERRKFYFASRYNRYNTHNQYLQELITNGFFGLSIFLLSLFGPLFANMLAEDKRFYTIFILCFAFICLTDTPLELNKGIVWYSFFNALIFFKSYNFKHKSINGKQAT